jgi:aspartate aminotransferase-like enzyme
VSGRPFLQVPGPTNVPERILRAMDRAVADHRGPELALTAEIVSRLRGVFGTRDAEIVLYPGSGTAAWEASLANTLSPGDRVVALNIGHFSHLYAECARSVGAWNLEILCKDPAERSNTTTTIELPVGIDSDEVLGIAYQRYGLSLGVGLGKLKGRAFRVGHLGSLNELEVLATIAGVELALHGAGIAIPLGAGVSAAERLFAAEGALATVGASSP